MTPPYRAQTLADLSELRALLPPARNADLFQTQEWFETLSQTGIEPDARPVTLVARPADGAGGIGLPLLLRRRGQAAVYGPVLSGLSNFYSSLYGPVGGPEHCSPQAFRALLGQLRQSHIDSAVLDLQPLDADAPLFRSMPAALREAGYFVDSYFCFGNWYLEVGGRRFDDYLGSIPSQLRNTIRRGRKKLDDGGEWSIAIHQVPGDELEQAIRDFEAIYRNSWKVPEPSPAFVPQLCRMAAHHGWLRLGVLRAGGSSIAAQLWLVKDGCALIYKLAYDQTYKRLSAGSVLSAAMMRHVIDVEQVDQVDYLTGDDSYKADWMSHRRERLGIVAFRRWSVRGLASAARHFGGRWWRRRQARQSTAAVAPTAHQGA